ncbi:MAG: FAD-dependent monooxygenase [Pseudomonadota bacterium]
MKDRYDILIAGGGNAGLTAAATLGQTGLSVLCVDPNPPVTDPEAEGADLRTTALLQPAQDLLSKSSAWSRLLPHASPLYVMRIVEGGGTEPKIHDFKSSDLSDDPFGWNFPNWLLRRELLATLHDLSNVTFRTGVSAGHILTRTAGTRVKLSDGNRVQASLVIAADGRNSWLRAQARIGVETRRYGQMALAFAVTHPIPHENVSTEIHRTGGPFTLVPLPDRDGLPCSAIVWMDDGPKSQARLNMDIEAFEAEMSDRSDHLFGPLTLASRRTIWPIVSQRAKRLVGERLALIAEAAHVVPPIGAQGLNMSLADVACLFDLIMADPQSIGAPEMLQQYERKRMRDIQVRVGGIDLLNRVSQVANPLLRDVRALGLDALHQVKPVRQTLMRMGLGLQRLG